VHDVFGGQRRKGNKDEHDDARPQPQGTGGDGLLALVLLSAIVFAVWTAETTSDRGGGPAIRATSAGGSDLSQDPYIARHAEIMARFHKGSLR
jgi:hypothetical protein